MMTTATRNRSDDVRVWPHRASLFALVAHAFRYPDATWNDVMGDESAWEAVRKGAARFDAPLVENLDYFRKQWRELKRRRRDKRGAFHLEERYTRLFGHAVHGACPAYELEYGPRDIVQQSPQLADIGGFYAAFGLELAESATERLDHISIECDFMAVLYTREYTAAMQADEDRRLIAHDARRRFFADHIGRWAPAFAYRVTRADDGFYAAAATLLASLLDEEAERLKVPLGPRYLEPDSPDPQRDGEVHCDCDDVCPTSDGGQRLVQLGVHRDAHLSEPIQGAAEISP